MDIMQRIIWKTIVVVMVSIGLAISLMSLRAAEYPSDKMVSKVVKDGKIVFVSPKRADGKIKTFEEIIGEFKGKVVYVDFWATWCGPCRMEMPNSAQIHQALEGKEVVFLYISFDYSEDKWKKGVESLKIEGYHFYPNDDQRIEIDSKFQVTSIPRYMIFDRAGKLRDANAIRPSSGQALIQRLSSLL
jgi:thiol-disulfide isomerase/thioredoxin